MAGLYGSRRPRSLPGFPTLARLRAASLRARQALTRAQEISFTSAREMPGKNSSSSVRSVSLMRKGITPR